MNLNIPHYKLNTILFVFYFSVLTICARLVQLQIHLTETFVSKSKKNFLRVEKIAPKRGNIVDSNGKLLATNRPIHNLYWQGSGKPNLTTDKKEMIRIIEKIINTSLVTDATIISKIKYAERYHKKVLIAEDIPFEQLSKIEEIFSEKNTISICTTFKRFYPYQSFASHLLGYLGRIDLEPMGKMGLEKMFQDSLKGKSGAILKTINSFGKKLSEKTIEQSLAGRNIKTTLNIEFINILEHIFPKNEIGTCLLMDPENGAIVALVSRPNFDPNIFLSPILKKDWENLQESHPFLNRAFDSCYPPGSIFKLVSISAALEKNIIEPNQTWECKGYTYFGKRKYWCHKHDGHGLLDASQALEQSCNTFFYDIAKKIDIDDFADYARRFGLGEKTNILLPEKQGTVPTKKWKLENKGKIWYPGETLSASIGQSFLSVTPIQIARMISSIFTGYLVTPRMLDEEPISKKPLDISKETLEFLRQSMKKVVTQGTGRNISKIKDFEDFQLYAKTSTAQTSARYKRKLGQIYREHRWFVLYFKYKNNRPLTLVILIEHSSTIKAAKNTANKFLFAYKRLIDTQ